MRKMSAILLCCWMLLMSSAAFACGSYVLIWDSDTRLLFEEEVRGYHHDTLGYVLNEIFARHGYHFDPNGRYGAHFENLNYIERHDTGFPYVEAPEEVSNEEIVKGLSDIELQNIRLIKRIIAEKQEAHDESGFYANWMCNDLSDMYYCRVVGEPSPVELPINLQIPVYSGPGEHYLRGANDRAMVSTNDFINAYGFDGDWLMIVYLVDLQTQQTRVGYIHRDAFIRELDHPACYAEEHSGYHDPVSQLDFSYTHAVLADDAALTDDPAGVQTPLVQLSRGEEVTVLLQFPRKEWDKSDTVDWVYVECGGAKPARGFIPLSALE